VLGLNEAIELVPEVKRLRLAGIAAAGGVRVDEAAEVDPVPLVVSGMTVT
jgi:hypothetical protein